MKLKITFGYNFNLIFKIHDTLLASRWVEALKAAQAFPYPIDDPRRFYGFNPIDIEQRDARIRINTIICKINEHEHLIDRTLTDVHDQDTLNYLHNIFEEYHGLLDQQTHPYYVRAPRHVRQALADLNVAVHRCESSYRTPLPRIVLTWYGLPKTRHFKVEDFQHITNQYKFGTVYLNYAEIGKTLEDFYTDNDAYISDEAFKPLDHFSADLTVKFFNVSDNDAAQRISDVNEYASTHKEFLSKLGYNISNPQLQPGLIPVAELESDLSESEILAQIKLGHYVSNVELLAK